MNELTIQRHALTMGDLFRIAEDIAGSGMVPDHLRGNVGGVVATILAGQELGLGAMASLRTIHLVKGKIVIGADAQLALLHQSGISTRWEETTDKAARLSLSRAPHTSAETFAYTIEEARTAGLANKDVWRKYAPAMLRARCISLAARAYAPEVLMGCYTPDEAAEFVDVQQLPTIEPPPDPVPEAPWEDQWADTGFDLEGEIIPFLLSNNMIPPSQMEPDLRRRTLQRLTDYPEKVEAFIEATRDDLRVHFVPRILGLIGPGVWKAYEGKKAAWKALADLAEAKRHHVQRAWWGVESLNDVTPAQALYQGRSIAWIRNDPDDFAGAVADALKSFDEQPEQDPEP